MPQLKWRASDEKYSAATVEDVFLEYWGGLAGAKDFQKQWDLQREFAGELRGKRFVLMSYIGMTSFTPPPADARDVLNRSRKDLAGHVAGAAVVMASRGFLAATLRAILAGLNRLQGGKSPSEVFASLEEACRWLAERPTQLDARSLEALAKEFVAAAEARRTAH
jgi:hypothetical protein